MMSKGPITGTFIDEITYDIPCSNWSYDQWGKDLDYMQEIGIDTVIFVRGGFGERTIYPSKAFGIEGVDDFAGFILKETAKRGMKVIFGLYISGINWNDGDAEGEIRKNKLFVDEVWRRYGEYPSFAGWYIPHEVCYNHLNIIDVMSGLSGICKDKTPDKDVMISPFFRTEITCAPYGDVEPFTLAQHSEEWEKMFEKAGKDIDICAFQDGTVPMREMEAYFQMISGLCKKYHMRHWVNVETFERDVRNQYYPISFSVLKERLEHHKKYVEKMITFEFSHFLSPQSIYPSARNLNQLYKNYYLAGKDRI